MAIRTDAKRATARRFRALGFALAAGLLISVSGCADAEPLSGDGATSRAEDPPEDEGPFDDYEDDESDDQPAEEEDPPEKIVEGKDDSPDSGKGKHDGEQKPKDGDDKPEPDDHAPDHEDSDPEPPTDSSDDSEPIDATVAYTCAGDGAGDCFLSVREQPTPDSAESVRLNEGTPVDVACVTTGPSVYSSALGRSSSVWAELDDGGYVAAIFLSAPGADLLGATPPRC